MQKDVAGVTQQLGVNSCAKKHLAVKCLLTILLKNIDNKQLNLLFLSFENR